MFVDSEGKFFFIYKLGGHQQKFHEFVRGVFCQINWRWTILVFCFWVTYTTYTPEKPNMDPIYIYTYLFIYMGYGFSTRISPFSIHVIFKLPCFVFRDLIFGDVTPWNCWFLPSLLGAPYGSPLSMVGQHGRLGESQVFLPLLGVLAERLSLWGNDSLKILGFLQNT